MPSMGLCHELVWFFRHNGYVKLPSVLPLDRIASLKSAIEQDVRDAVEPVVRNAEGRVVRLSKLLSRDRVFSEAVTGPEVLEPLTALLGPNIEIVTNRHNHATLNLGGKADTFHRDVVQWSRGLVTVIFYLEATHLENGCTQVVPGSHLWPGVNTLHNLHQESEIETSGLLAQAVPVPMPAGGMLAIDSLVFHRIGDNVTDQTRMSMTIGYHSVDELAEADQPKRLLAQGERIYKGNDR